MDESNKIKRRDFLKVSGTFSIVAVAGCAGKHVPVTQSHLAADIQSEYPVCEGYILVDTKKCQGCLSCMLACSLAHHGSQNLSLARIQVIQNPFERYPYDISVEQCRQCVEPECVKQCPEGALYIDTANANIRRVDADKCVGCMTCIESCPHLPGRAIWNVSESRAQKCDLCTEPRYWNEKGKQACIEVCPVNAIKFQHKVPVQQGDRGYKVNLRGEGWAKLGYPVD